MRRTIVVVMSGLLIGGLGSGLAARSQARHQPAPRIQQSPASSVVRSVPPGTPVPGDD